MEAITCRTCEHGPLKDSFGSGTAVHLATCLVAHSRTSGFRCRRSMSMPAGKRSRGQDKGFGGGYWSMMESIRWSRNTPKLDTIRYTKAGGMSYNDFLDDGGLSIARPARAKVSTTPLASDCSKLSKNMVLTSAVNAPRYLFHFRYTSTC